MKPCCLLLNLLTQEPLPPRREDALVLCPLALALVPLPRPGLSTQSLGLQQLVQGLAPSEATGHLTAPPQPFWFGCAGEDLLALSGWAVLLLSPLKQTLILLPSSLRGRWLSTKGLWSGEPGSRTQTIRNPVWGTGCSERQGQHPPSPGRGRPLLLATAHSQPRSLLC